ncbi:hypothetical protein TCAL_14707 [Tigriopus californicus]|uniref:Uncharacterized protein n=1 Tax=Tigriopus californicus TaxID=6832 RepID=A0A553PGY4_TIGCA|nr:uncharacterized protein LOC131881091 [Tigriopus californicus]TRY76941.1 hypothetical protein TCAL_14707 [Tigriopus californicus]
MSYLSFMFFLVSLFLYALVAQTAQAKTLPNVVEPSSNHVLSKREPYYNNGYYNNYPNNNYNHHHNSHHRPCGPFRRRACHPGLRAATVIGTAAFGGALIGSGLRGKK